MLLADLLAILSPRQRFVVCLLGVGMVAGSMLEALAVGLTLPLFGMLSDPSRLPDNAKLQVFYNLVHVTEGRQGLMLIGFLVLTLYVVKNVFLTGLTYLEFRFVYRTQAEVSRRLLELYLLAPWTFHLQRNSAELLRNIQSEVPLLFGNILNPLVVAVSELLVIVSVVVLLMLVDWISSLSALTLLGTSGVIFYLSVRGKTDRIGVEQQQTRGSLVQWVNQGLGGIKETKVLGREGYFVRMFATHSNHWADASIYLATVSQLPRFFFETLIVVTLLLVSAISLSRGQEGASMLPQLALFGVAGYRLIPSLNRIAGAVANIRYHLPAARLVRLDLESLAGNDICSRHIRSMHRLSFAREIELRDVCFRYPGTAESVLSHVSLTIPKGSTIALTGHSGAGKTTLVDVILGLLRPNSGHVLVDGFDISDSPGDWQRIVGYIPQSIYLSDDTIRRNVAFAVDDGEIDDSRVWMALRSAQLEEFVAGLPEGLDARTGERGVCLSGGQRQRIGIARALYHDPEVLVLDEATSSLDNETEQEVAKAIERLSGYKTLIIIAHRLSTIEHCQMRYEIEAGKLQRWPPVVGDATRR